MPWLFLAILTTIFWSFTNIFDKVLVSDYSKSPFLAMALVNFASWPLLLPVILFLGFPLLEPGVFLIFSIAVLSNIAAVLLYYKAMKGEEASRIMTAYNTFPLFTLALAVLLLGESVSVVQFIGIVFLVLGAILVSLKKIGGFQLRKWLFIVFLSASLFALDTVITKSLLLTVEWWPLLVWRSAFFSILLVVALPLYYKKIIMVVSRKPKSVILALLSQGFYLSGRAFLLIALSIGLASLVSAVTSFQPFSVLLIAIASTVLFPKFLREEIDTGNVFIKIIAVILAVAGAIMVA